MGTTTISQVAQIPQVKLVYFNRRETDLECDKLDDAEIFTLRNKFEGSPERMLYRVEYYAPMANGCNGLYWHDFLAIGEQDTREQFDIWKVKINADWKIHIKRIYPLQQEMFKG